MVPAQVAEGPQVEYNTRTHISAGTYGRIILPISG
jgi:hypothetical protein